MRNKVKPIIFLSFLIFCLGLGLGLISQMATAKDSNTLELAPVESAQTLLESTKQPIAVLTDKRRFDFNVTIAKSFAQNQSYKGANEALKTFLLSGKTTFVNWYLYAYTFYRGIGGKYTYDDRMKSVWRLASKAYRLANTDVERVEALTLIMGTRQPRTATVKQEEVLRQKRQRVLKTLTMRLHGAKIPTVQQVALQQIKAFGPFSTSVVPKDRAAIGCVSFTQALLPKGQINLADYVTIKDADQKTSKPLKVSVYTQSKRLCFDGLVYGKLYNINIKKGFPARNGQKLGWPIQSSINVSHRTPNASFQTQGMVLPAYGEQNIPFSSVNAKRVYAKLMQIPAENIAEFARGSFSRDAYTFSRIQADYGSLEFKGWVEPKAQADQQGKFSINLKDMLKGKAVKPGLYMIGIGLKDFRDNIYSNKASFLWFSVSDMGVSLLKGKDGLHVLVRSLKTGQALPKAQVTLRAYNNRVLAKKTTGAHGRTLFSAPIMAGAGSDRPAFVWLTDDKGGVAFLSVNRRSLDLTNWDISGRKSFGDIETLTTTQRGIYRAGETVYATILLRNSKGAAFENPPQITAKLLRPDGVVSQKFTLNDAHASGYVYHFGLNRGVQTGLWTLAYYSNPKAGAIGKTTFMVEDFVPPKIKVEVLKAPRIAHFGDKVTLDVQANYFFGQQAAGLDTNGSVTIKKAQNPFPAWKGFHFGLAQEKFEPIYKTIEGTKTSALGKATLSFALKEQADTFKPLVIETQVNVFEQGGRARSVYKKIAYLSKPFYIGIKPSFEGGQVGIGIPQQFNVVALNDSGKAVAKKTLQYSLIKEDESYNWYHYRSGWNYEVTVTDGPILQQGKLESLANKATTLDIPNLQWGKYRLEVFDKETGISSSYRYQVGWWNTLAQADRPESLETALDKKTYRVGDNVQLVVKSPFQGALVVAVATSNSVHFIDFGNVGTKGKTVSIPIKGNLANTTGFYLLPMVYRAADVKNKRLPRRALGVTWVSLDSTTTKLNMHFDNLPSVIKPKTSLSIPLVIDNKGPLSTVYVTVAGVDKAVLGLTDYKPLAPTQEFFSKQRLNYKLYDNYGNLIDGAHAKRLKVRFGGGALLGRRGHTQGVLVRSSKVVSLFSGPVKVVNGKAQITFEIPEFNGRLTLMALGWSKTKMGHVTQDIIVRTPVVASVSLPRFLAVGDKAQGVISLHNISGPSGNYKLSFATTGKSLALGTTKVQEISLTNGQNVTIPLVLSALNKGVEKIKMTLVYPDGTLQEKSLALTVRATQEKAILVNNGILGSKKKTSYSVSSNQEQTPLFKSGTQDISLTLATTPYGQSYSLGETLLAYPYRCLEQTTSRGMGLMAYAKLRAQDDGLKVQKTGLKAQDDGGKIPNNLKKQVQLSLERLQTLQRSDGLFGLWSSFSPRAEFLSVYATDFISRAQKQGYKIPGFLLDNAVGALKKLVRSRNDETQYTYETMAYAHYVLARLNQDDIGILRHFVDMYKDKIENPVSLAYLMRALDFYGDTKRIEELKKIILGKKMLEKQGALKLVPFYRIVHQKETLFKGFEKKEEQYELVFDKEISQITRFSTFDMAQLLEASALGLNDKIKVSVNGRQEVGKGIVYMKGIKPQAQNELINQGKLPIFYQWKATGTPLKPLPAYQTKAIKIEKTYVDVNGKAVDLQHVAVGSLVVVHIKGHGLGQLLIVDPLPAGFEIAGSDNLESLPVINKTGWKNSPDVAFVAAKDDRFVFALKKKRQDEGGAVFSYTYLARAVSVGSFTIPAIYVEDMNNPETFARGVVSSLNVVSNVKKK